MIVSSLKKLMVHWKGLKSSKDTWEAYSGLCVTTGYKSNYQWTIRLDLACLQLPAGLLGSSDNVSFCGFLWGAQLGKKIPSYPYPTHEAHVKKAQDGWLVFESQENGTN